MGRPPRPLAPAPPWVFLLTHEEGGRWPGVYVVGRAADKSEMRWGPYSADDAAAQLRRLEALQVARGERGL